MNYAEAFNSTDGQRTEDMGDMFASAINWDRVNSLTEPEVDSILESLGDFDMDVEEDEQFLLEGGLL